MPTKRRTLSVYPNEKIARKLGAYSSKTFNSAIEFFADLQYPAVRSLLARFTCGQWDCFAHAFHSWEPEDTDSMSLARHMNEHFRMVQPMLPYEDGILELCRGTLDGLTEGPEYSAAVYAWVILNTVRLRWARWPDKAPFDWQHTIYEGTL